MNKDSINIFNQSWSAILMSLTALVTAWSAYQANLWTGNQAVELAQALEARTVLTQDVLSANEHKMMDGILALEVVKAVAGGQNNLSDFIVPRLREELRKPLADWLAMDPLHNKNAPAHPLLMPEYVEQVVKKSTEQQSKVHKEIGQNMQEARQAGATSDSYVLLTVLFAAVLFFAGIASTFTILRLQVILLGLATTVMVISLWMLSSLNIAAG